MRCLSRSSATKKTGDALRDAVRPGGVVEFVDVTPHERRMETADEDQPDVAVQRLLADGRVFRIVKIFREPNHLTARLAGLGWRCSIQEVHPGVLYATCRRRD